MWGVCKKSGQRRVSFVKKSGKWGCFCKKVDLSSTQGALCTVAVFFYFTFYFLGGCVCTQRTPLPTGLNYYTEKKLRCSRWTARCARNLSAVAAQLREPVVRQIEMLELEHYGRDRIFGRPDRR